MEKCCQETWEKAVEACAKRCAGLRKVSGYESKEFERGMHTAFELAEKYILEMKVKEGG